MQATQQNMSEQHLIERLEAENLDLKSRMDLLREEVGIPAARLIGGRLCDANLPWGRLFGFNRGAGLSGSRFLDLVVPRDRDRIRAALNRLARRVPSSELLVLEAFRADGSTMGVRLHAHALMNDRGPVIELTGAPWHAGEGSNPIVLGRLRLSRELIAWPYSEPHGGAVARLSIHDFAALEERAGFADAAMIGDELENRVRERLNSGLLAFRIELHTVIVLCRGGKDDAVATLAGLAEAVQRKPFHGRRETLRVTLDVSIRHLPAQIRPQAVLELLRAAGPEDDPAPADDEDDDWNARIERALRTDALSLGFQPVRPLAGGRIHHDVTVSLRDGDGVMHPLQAFARQAVASGLMAAIDRWVIGRLAEMLRQGELPPGQLFVKLSTDSVAAGAEFVDWLCENTGDETELARKLVFDIAEPTVVACAEQALELADELKIRGFEISLFGARGADAAHIDDMPLDWIRLDPDCAPPLLGDTPLPAELEWLLEFASRNHIRLSAPGMDPERDSTRLWRFGIGWLDGRPEQGPDSGVSLPG